MKNKLAILLSSAILSAAVLGTAACSGAENTVKISMGIWPTEANSDILAFYNDCKERFETDYPQYEIVGASYTYSEDNVAAKILSGQLPTLFSIDYRYAPSAYRNGYIRDAAPFLRQLGWYGDIADDVAAEISAGNVLFGVPKEQNATGLLLNLGMLEEAGVIGRNADGTYRLYTENGEPLYPVTFGDIETACVMLKRRYGSGCYGLFVPSADENGGRIIANIAYNFGGGDIEVCDGDGNWRVDLQSEAIGDALRWVKYMAQSGYIDDSKAFETNDWIEEMADGNIAIAFCNSDEVIRAVSTQGLIDGDIALVPVPSYDGTSRTLWSGSVYAVSGKATDEQARGAMLFLKYLGESPETDYVSLGAIERKLSNFAESELPVFPVLSVWKDSSYLAATERLYAAYGNVPYAYFGKFFDGVAQSKRQEEPYYVWELYAVLNRLQQTMVFQPTSSNLVALLEEEERAFNENYMAKIKA